MTPTAQGDKESITLELLGLERPELIELPGGMAVASVLTPRRVLVLLPVGAALVVGLTVDDWTRRLAAVRAGGLRWVVPGAVGGALLLAVAPERTEWFERRAERVEAVHASLPVDTVYGWLKELPPGARLGANKNAFAGGYRLWKDPLAGKRSRTHVRN